MGEDDRRERTTAPDEVIIFGYFMTEAREALRQGAEGYGGNYVARAFWYLTEAVERSKAARKAMESQPNWMQMLPSKGMLHITRACTRLATYIGSLSKNPMEEARIEHMIGTGHGELHDMMRTLRYKVITDADFERVRKQYKLPGGGGGR